MNDTSSTPIPGDVAGYAITRMLGEGGMSVVYAAMQREPKRLVALKVLKGSNFPPSTLRRFKREVEILGKLRHPGIAQVYEAGTWDDGSGAKPYFVMEYIAGGRDLTDYITERSLTLEQRIKLFIRVCAAVDHGHRRKIVHRDLKPGNILVDENGDVKIIDYGVARVSEVEIGSQQTMQTEAGRLVGTVQYMAPEQVDMAMQDIDGRCDVYAMGILLYQIVTGVMPHELEGQPIFEAMRVIREDAAPSPRQLNSEVDRDLETIIYKALEKERSRRYAGAGELGKDLLRYLKNEPIKARRASLAYRSLLLYRRHRTVTIAAAAVLFVTIVAALTTIFLPDWLNSGREAELQSKVQDARQRQAMAEAQRDAAIQDAAPRRWIPTTPYVLKGLDGAIKACRIGPTGTTCCALTESSVGLWTLPDARRLSSGDTSDLAPRHLAYSRSGSVLAIAGRSEIICVDLDGGVEHRWTMPRPEPIAIAVSDDGTMLAISSDDFSVTLHRVDGTQVARTTSSRGAFTGLAFGSDEAGAFLAGASDGRVSIWRAVDGLAILRRVDTPEDLLAIVCSESTGVVRVVASTGLLISCPVDPAAGDIDRASVGDGGLLQASFDPTGDAILVVRESNFEVWSLDTMRPSTPSMPRPAEAGVYALGPGGSSVAHADSTGTVTMTPLVAD